ncbi:hypothetical protein K435DRAFT_786767 [Dendrothele bispora CBS 962.96]|uniref:Uncharacterized protein n=1 Tax=Dendrothele bispora (strain CBS 962.96) TaxID=1314807 RepID=A0A4S8KP74_DENBC|nr:hypothetical protein K435DRAFT_786767 [Dendrothele bispora CBS 962.96]
MVGTKIAKARKYGYDSTKFPSHPTRSPLLDLARGMSVHILPGESDRDDLRGMFGDLGVYDSSSCETNPVWLKLREGETEQPAKAQTKTKVPPSPSPFFLLFLVTVLRLTLKVPRSFGTAV